MSVNIGVFRKKPKKCWSIFEIKQSPFICRSSRKRAQPTSGTLQIQYYIMNSAFYVFRDLFITILQRQQCWKKPYSSCQCHKRLTKYFELYVYGALEGGASKIDRFGCLKGHLMANCPTADIRGIWFRRYSGNPHEPTKGEKYRERKREKNSKKNLDSYCFVTYLWLLSMKNHVNVTSKSNRQKNLEKKNNFWLPS